MFSWPRLWFDAFFIEAVQTTTPGISYGDIRITNNTQGSTPLLNFWANSPSRYQIPFVMSSSKSMALQKKRLKRMLRDSYGNYRSWWLSWKHKKPFAHDDAEQVKLNKKFVYLRSWDVVCQTGVTFVKRLKLVHKNSNKRMLKNKKPKTTVNHFDAICG